MCFSFRTCVLNNAVRHSSFCPGRLKILFLIGHICCICSLTKIKFSTGLNKNLNALRHYYFANFQHIKKLCSVINSLCKYSFRVGRIKYINALRHYYYFANFQHIKKLCSVVNSSCKYSFRAGQTRNINALRHYYYTGNLLLVSQ